MRGLAVGLAIAIISSGARAGEVSVTLAVDNMTCALCPITVKAAISRVPGVRAVTVDLEERTAVVVYEDTQTSVDKLAEASRNAGFPARRKE